MRKKMLAGDLPGKEGDVGSKNFTEPSRSGLFGGVEFGL